MVVEGGGGGLSLIIPYARLNVQVQNRAFLINYATRVVAYCLQFLHIESDPPYLLPPSSLPSSLSTISVSIILRCYTPDPQLQHVNLTREGDKKSETRNEKK